MEVVGGNKLMEERNKGQSVVRSLEMGQVWKLDGMKSVE